MSGSESETFIDPVYLGLGVNPFHIDHGTLSLLAEPTSKRIMSTVEARIKISNVPGTWPERLGDEIDVMETLGGRPTRQHKSDHRRVDRQKRDQSKTLDKVDLSADFATYGLLWMADTIAHYPDSVEIGRFPNLGLHSPMYLIGSMDMDGDWNKTGGQRPTKRTCEYDGSICEELPIGRFMLGVGRIANRSDAYAKYSSNGQKMVVTMREAELSNATESLAIERSDLPVGIANGALLPPRIVAKDIGSVSYGAGHAPTQHLLVSGLSATSAMLASKAQKGLSLLPDVAASSGMLVRNPVATATASILSVRVAMLSRASRKTTLEAALQNVT